MIAAHVLVSDDVECRARLAEARVKSMVVGLPVDGSILVARLCGVRRHMKLLLSRASEMDLPALLVYVPLSHML